jgi:hypothetical protein
MSSRHFASWVLCASGLLFLGKGNAFPAPLDIAPDVSSILAQHLLFGSFLALGTNPGGSAQPAWLPEH